MPYCIYLRKSRADVEAEARGEGETLARHRHALTELAAQRGYDVARIYQEIGSSDTISERPQMRALLAAVERGEYEGVIVNDSDRLARGDSFDQGVVKRAFSESGTLIITPYKTFDPADPADEDFFDFSLFMARVEYKLIRRRMQTGRMRSAAEGNYLGSRTVYGYRRVKRPDRSGWTLEPDPDTAPIVRMVFEWYVHGDPDGTPLSSTAIAHRLNAMGLRTDLGHPFDAGRIRYMLTNSHYIGTMSWAKRVRRVSVADGERVVTRPRNDAPIIVEHAHPALVDRDLWDQVQTMFAGHAKLPTHDDLSVSNPLAGLVHCSECGHAMQRKPGAGGRPDLIHCLTEGCPTTGCYIPIVEHAILDALARWSLDYSASAPEPAAAKSADDSPAAALRRQIDTLLQQRERLHDLVEQGVYTPADFVRRRGDLDARIADTRAQLTAYETAPTTEDLIRMQLPQIRHVLDVYPSTPDPNERNRLLRSILSNVVYTKTHRCYRNEDPSQFLTITLYPRLF